MLYLFILFFLPLTILASAEIPSINDSDYLNSIHVIHGEWIESESDLSAGPLELKRIFQPQPRHSYSFAEGWHFNLPDVYAQEIPRKRVLHSPKEEYRFEYDEAHRLTALHSIHPLHKLSQGSITIEYSPDKNHFIAKSSNGETVHYGLTPQLNGGSLLTSVRKEGYPEIRYRYQNHPVERKPLVIEKSIAGRETLYFHYWDTPEEGCNDPMRSLRLGKLRALYRSEATDAAPQLVCHLVYEKHVTKVQYAAGSEMHYRFNGLEQILSISTFLQGNLYRIQEFDWNQQNVSRKAVKDAEGHLLSEERYEYDQEGRLSKEILFGTLSGTNPSTSESYTKINRYDPSGKLIEIIEENGQSTTYSYDAETGHLSMKCQKEKEKILMRTLYRYSIEGFLAEEIQDDADTENPHSWEHATRRQYHETLSRTAQGDPLIEANGFYELTTGAKLEEQQIHFAYDDKGREIAKRIYSNEGVLLSDNERSFDSDGKIRWERERDEERFFTYDAYGNLTGIRAISPRLTKETSYHSNGLLLQESTEIPHRVARLKKYQYDGQHRLISVSDALGNVWGYTYDALGRKTSESVPQGEGCITTTFFKYDPLDRLIAIEDSDHYHTASSYNARGQPLTVLYADGTEERFEYTKDGRLICMIGRDGITKRAERDLFDRLTHEWVFDIDKQLIEESSYRYNSFDLIAETNSKGVTTLYHYDHKGRKIAEKSPQIGIRADFSYSKGNEITTKREWFGDQFVESRRTSPSNRWKLYTEDDLLILEEPEQSTQNEPVHEEITWLSNGTIAVCQISHTTQGCTIKRMLDPLDRVCLEEIYSLSGTLIAKQKFGYDAQGRMTMQEIVRIHNGQEIGTVQNYWEFGPCGRLERVIEKHGSAREEITAYTYDAFGRLHQIIKPDGVILEHAFDAAGRLSQFSSSDHTVHYQFEYDAQGNLLSVLNATNGKATVRTYSSNGQIASERLENELEIGYTFDALGRKTSIKLPDQSRIDYLYDSLFLKEVQRKTVQGHLLYTHRYSNYDLQGNPVEQQMIGDLGTICLEGKLKINTPYYTETAICNDQGLIQSRASKTASHCFENRYSYDAFNQLVKENDQQHAFDSMGCLQDADGSGIRDLNGNLISQMRSGLHYRYVYDALNRLTAVYENQIEILSCSYDAFHRRTTTTHAGKEKRYLYEGNHEIGSYGKTCFPQELRILGRTKEAEAFATIAIELNGEILAPIHDLTGSICMLVDLHHQIRSHRTYSAFGSSRELEKNAVISAWGYSGKRLDQETGLIYYGRRYYDPHLKQWTTKDPIGFADGANRLAFVRNNPLSLRDHYGLTAEGDKPHSIKEEALKLLKSIGAKILHTIRKIKDYTNMGLTQTLDHMVGRGFLLLLGYYKTNAHKGCYGMGEVNDKVRVSFINGILTDYASLYSTLQSLSTSHGGVNIHYIYRPTKGWVYDIIHSFLVKVGYVSTQAHALADEWKSMIADMGGVSGGGLIIHYAHSIGAVESLRALSLLSPEEQKMIKIYAFGSPNLSSSGGEAEINHFVSVRDGVSLLDPFGFIQACRGQINNVLFVGSFWGIPLVDHLFSAQCYQDLWKSMGRTFVEWYGTLLG